MDQKVTIIDVAKRAGVSKGTVDRVLHNRGEVSAKSAEKVRKAIEELNFHPNVYAALLASRKSKTIACIMPEHKPGSFWEMGYNGFKRGAEAVESLNVHLEFFFYDQNSVESFEKRALELLETKPDAVMLPALFQQATMEFVSQLAAKGIPYMYVDTKVMEDTDYLAYVGMPRRDSGILCAALLTEGRDASQVKSIALVRVKSDLAGISDPTKRRREGFTCYIKENFPQAVIHNVFIDPSDQQAIDAEMNNFLSQHPDTDFVAMVNSRIHLIGNALQAHPNAKRRVIGFDDLAQNRQLLEKGIVSAIIAQHVEDHTVHAVEMMADYIFTKKAPAVKDNFVHMDILNRFNLMHY